MNIEMVDEVAKMISDIRLSDITRLGSGHMTVHDKTMQQANRLNLNPWFESLRVPFHGIAEETLWSYCGSIQWSNTWSLCSERVVLSRDVYA